MSPADASGTPDQPDPRPTNEKGPRAKPLAARPINTDDHQAQEKKMSNQTVPQAAVMPEGVLHTHRFSAADIVDFAGVIRRNDYVFIRKNGEKWAASSEPISPEERIARIGDVLHDGSTVVGAYLVVAINDGVALLQLESTVWCSVHEWCRGHRADELMDREPRTGMRFEKPSSRPLTEHHGFAQVDPRFDVYGRGNYGWTARADLSGSEGLDVALHLDATVTRGEEALLLAGVLEEFAARLRGEASL